MNQNKTIETVAFKPFENMISKNSILRIARPTDNLSTITAMYIKGLGFELLGEFHGHDGFSGSIIGHPIHAYHLEFTHHIGTTVSKAPTQDNLLVFYIAEKSLWSESCKNMTDAGFTAVNPTTLIGIPQGKHLKMSTDIELFYKTEAG